MKKIYHNLQKTIAIILCWFVSVEISAHPHSFIAMKTHFVVTESQLTAIKFTWTMDEMTSSYLKYDAELSDEQIFNDVMINIFENNFFSEFYLNTNDKKEKIVLMPQAQGAALDLNDVKAVATFWGKLKAPINLSGQQFELMTYERTFYVDMFYQQLSDITIDAPNCQILLIKPTPDDFALSYAIQLDKDEVPTESDDFVLGKIFAQKVKLSCQ